MPTLILRISCDIGDISNMSLEEISNRRQKCIDRLPNIENDTKAQTYTHCEGNGRQFTVISVGSFDIPVHDVIHHLTNMYGSGTLTKSANGQHTFAINDVYEFHDN
jgi:hypothetical protein